MVELGRFLTACALAVRYKQPKEATVMQLHPKEPRREQEPKPEPIDPPSDAPPVELPVELPGDPMDEPNI